MRFLASVRVLLFGVALVPALSASATTPEASQSLARTIPHLRVLRSEGIAVTLSDRHGITTQNFAQPLGGLVRDQDVISLVNEMRAAGAFSISVGGVRLSKSSVIRFVGSRLFVEGKPVSVPVRVEAMGNAAQLKARLAARGGILDSFKASGPGAYLTVVQVPQFKGAQSLKAAQKRLAPPRQTA